MTMGTGVVLFVIGAILAFAVHLGNGVFSFTTAGYILMLAGAVVFVIGLAVTLVGRRTVTSSRSTVDPASGDAVRRDSTVSTDPRDI